MQSRNYKQFLSKKAQSASNAGFEVERESLNPALFDFQRDIVSWALRKGRVALFCDCGLGKTLMQLEWANKIDGRTLILAPLAVAQQTVREGRKFGIEASYARHPITDARITVTNYEMLPHFNISEYAGIVLDESSILKSFEGKTRNEIISAFERTPYRLACTATPAPNDYMELGNHSEFLGVLSRTEMLSTFFVHDGGDTSKWRLKKHAIKDFWRWVCSWAVTMRKPSDLGYSDADFSLPELRFHDVTVEASHATEGMLFAMTASTMQERRSARNDSIESRAAKIAEIVTVKPKESWIIWCNLNAESALAAKLTGGVEVSGSDSREEKERRMLAFESGDIRVLVTKPSICGFGMNWQHCANVAFLGLSDSYEQFYQAVRRSWRFGQKRAVDCYIVTARNEGAVTENIKRKERDAQNMAKEMSGNTSEINRSEINKKNSVREEKYETQERKGKDWRAICGDCVEVVQKIAADSIHYSIFSPPFASLYTYSASDRDMGNCRTHAEFFEHFKFLTTALHRVTMPGRLLSFHCMNLPTSKQRDGVIGISDFRGDLIRLFQEAGFIYHSEVVIWKDPVTAMQRTKALGLLHKQIKKDSCMSRQGIPDYLVTMRKAGENPERVAHTNESFPVSLWQRYASPVWMDIDAGDTLQRTSARAEEDERHICPLQLGVIRRAIELWTNPEDLVLSPFAGIGSEGYIALQMRRRFVGVELKKSYFEQCVANLMDAQSSASGLFEKVDSK